MFVILSGVLGAGACTMLSAYLRQPMMTPMCVTLFVAINDTCCGNVDTTRKVKCSGVVVGCC